MGTYEVSPRAPLSLHLRGDEIDIQLQPSLRAPRIARRAVEESLVKAVPPTVLNDAKLLVSELVTNCLQHAELEPNESIGLSVEVDEDSGVIRVTVSNPGPGFDPSDVAPRLSARGGRGLHLVQEIATRWGRKRDGTTVVWFELATA